MKNKVCSFFGHRNTILDNEKYERLRIIIENLVTELNVNIFLFGSKSQFDFVCHKIVTELKEKYPNIIRKCYTCTSEACILESEKNCWEKIYSRFKKDNIPLLGVEAEIEHKTKYTAGKASYIERNQAMINDSDYCIIYYNEKYEPELRKYSKNSIGYYQPKSGTALAYIYARQKKKIIINIAEQ